MYNVRAIRKKREGEEMKKYNVYGGVVAIILDPGEDGNVCISPGGSDMDGECVEAPEFEQCSSCNETGWVVVRE